MEILKIPQEAFDSGVLNKDYHDRLIANLEGFATTANIPRKWVWSRLSEFCGGDEIAWVKTMRHAEDSGMAYVGSFDTPVEDKMMAITGACLRNYIDARVMTVQQVISLAADDALPTPTVLLIPNFCLDKGAGGDIPAWQASLLMGVLYSRMAQSLKTVLYASSMTALEKNYGTAMREHVQSHYTLVGQ